MKQNQTTASVAVTDVEAYLNELVAIKLFRDNDRYRDDVYVAVNGHNCLIKRGEWVKIKRKFAMGLDQSEIQDMKTAEMREASARLEFEQAAFLRDKIKKLREHR